MRIAVCMSSIQCPLRYIGNEHHDCAAIHVHCCWPFPVEYGKRPGALALVDTFFATLLAPRTPPRGTAMASRRPKAFAVPGL